MAAITIALLLTAGAVGCSAAGPQTVVTVDTAHPGAVLPEDFLGLSFEASVLSSDLFDPARSNLPALLRDLGPGRLRFGGNSVDRVAAWTADPAAPLPPWARSRVDPEDLARLGALTAATGWKVDLGLTLGHPDPMAAAGEAAAAQRLIGPGLGSVQIGNEPDLLGDARSNLAAYRAAIAAAAPTVAVSGPDTADPAALATYATAEDAFLTQHFYPLSRCGGATPTIAQLLSPSTRTSEERLADEAVAAGRTVRIDETNSASCGGQDGVSNTLASALWMVEYLIIAAQHGVAGVGIEGGLAACRGYTPLCVPGAKGAAEGTAPGIDPTADASLGAAPGGRLVAQPDFYGLLLVHELEGGRWLPVTSSLWAAAAQMPGGAVRVVIVNPSPKEVTVRLAGPSRVQWLTGPSLAATSGVELGGAQVGADGTWQPLAGAVLAPTLRVPAATAALIY